MDSGCDVFISTSSGPISLEHDVGVYSIGKAYKGMLCRLGLGQGEVMFLLIATLLLPISATLP